MVKTPVLKEIEKFVDDHISLDGDYKKALKRGFMSRGEMIIAEFISRYCSLNKPPTTDIEQSQKEIAKILPTAYEAATKQFDVSVEEAKELYNKSRHIQS
jgi:hypothetical protein